MTYSNDTNAVDQSSIGYHFSPFLRYYALGSDKIKVFGDLVVGYGFGQETNKPQSSGVENTEKKYSTWDAGIYAGAQYWLTSNWSIVTKIGVLDFTSKTNDKDGMKGNNTNVVDKSTSTTDTHFGLNIDIASVTFSLNFHF